MEEKSGHFNVREGEEPKTYTFRYYEFQTLAEARKKLGDVRILECLNVAEMQRARWAVYQSLKRAK